MTEAGQPPIFANCDVASFQGLRNRQRPGTSHKLIVVTGNYQFRNRSYTCEIIDHERPASVS